MTNFCSCSSFNIWEQLNLPAFAFRSIILLINVQSKYSHYICPFILPTDIWSVPLQYVVRNVQTWKCPFFACCYWFDVQNCSSVKCMVFIDIQRTGQTADSSVFLACSNFQLQTLTKYKHPNPCIVESCRFLFRGHDVWVLHFAFSWCFRGSL